MRISSSCEMPSAICAGRARFPTALRAQRRLPSTSSRSSRARSAGTLAASLAPLTRRHHSLRRLIKTSVPSFGETGYLADDDHNRPRLRVIPTGPGKVKSCASTRNARRFHSLFLQYTAVTGPCGICPIRLDSPHPQTTDTRAVGHKSARPCSTQKPTQDHPPRSPRQKRSAGMTGLQAREPF